MSTSSSVTEHVIRPAWCTTDQDNGPLPEVAVHKRSLFGAAFLDVVLSCIFNSYFNASQHFAFTYFHCGYILYVLMQIFLIICIIYLCFSTYTVLYSIMNIIFMLHTPLFLFPYISLCLYKSNYNDPPFNMEYGIKNIVTKFNKKLF